MFVRRKWIFPLLLEARAHIETFDKVQAAVCLAQACQLVADPPEEAAGIAQAFCDDYANREWGEGGEADQIDQKKLRQLAEQVCAALDYPLIDNAKLKAAN